MTSWPSCMPSAAGSEPRHGVMTFCGTQDVKHIWRGILCDWLNACVRAEHCFREELVQSVMLSCIPEIERIAYILCTRSELHGQPLGSVHSLGVSPICSIECATAEADHAVCRGMQSPMQGGVVVKMNLGTSDCVTQWSDRVLMI